MDGLTINFNISFTDGDCECMKHDLSDNEFFGGTYNNLTKKIFVYFEMHLYMMVVERITNTLLHELIHWGCDATEYQTSEMATEINDWLNEVE